MEDLKNSIIKVIQVIDGTATLFYQQKNQEGFQTMDFTLSSLIQAINEIQAYQADKAEKPFDSLIFNIVLTEAIKAMEQKDTILLADILTYEVNASLEEYLQRI